MDDWNVERDQREVDVVIGGAGLAGAAMNFSRFGVLVLVPHREGD